MLEMNQYLQRQGLGGTRLCIGKWFPSPSPTSMQEGTKLNGQGHAPVSLPAGKVPSFSIGGSEFG